MSADEEMLKAYHDAVAQRDAAYALLRDIRSDADCGAGELDVIAAIDSLIGLESGQ